MEKVGVEAVVEGLSAFISDTRKLNSAIADIRPEGTLLQRVFEGITGTLAAFGREILNVAEYALGHLLADAIEFVVGKIVDLVNATIQAGSEFQTLDLRLRRLNFNTLIESGVEFNEAMKEAITLTRDQLNWITQLAATTPYDAQDIANVFTLARSYGFAADAAKGLTKDITNFAAGMGLGNTEIQRIIVNFGQMVQQGKVTQREMNDLARGSFVPVNDILKRMQQNVGKTGKEFDKFRMTGEGVNAFMTAFSQIVEERFQGAAEDMAKTFQGATANAQDFVKSIFGLNTVKPILDVIGTKIAEVVSSLTDPGKMSELTKWAGILGQSLSGLLSDILGLGNVNADSVFQGLVKGMQNVITWINTNREKILKLFKDIKYYILQYVLPFVQRIVDGFNTIRDWVSTNKPVIEKFFSTLGEIIGQVFNIDTSKLGSLDGVLSAITDFMQYVIDNKDAIAQWAEIILKAVVAWQILATVLAVIGGLIAGVIGFILGIITSIAGVISLVSVLITVLSGIGGVIVTLLAGFALLFGAIVLGFTLGIQIGTAFKTQIQATIGETILMFLAWYNNLVTIVDNLIQMIISRDWTGVGTAIVNFIRAGFAIAWGTLLALVSAQVNMIKTTFTEQPWGTIGRGIIEGVRVGVMKAAEALIAAVKSAIEKALQAARAAAKIKSPSKEGQYIGEMTIAGITKGIQHNASAAASAMQDAMAMIAAPMFALPSVSQQVAVAAPASVNNSTSYTNNFNLTVNSRANREPIIQDYNTMKALIGA